MKWIVCTLLLFAGLLVSAYPEVSSVSPASGTRGQTLIIRIQGSETRFTAAPNTVELFNYGSIIADSVKVLNDTLLDAFVTLSIHEPVGQFTVIVYNDSMGPASKGKSFTVTGPTIQSISPVSGLRGQNLNMDIIARGTNFTQYSPPVVTFWNPLWWTPDTAVVHTVTVINDTVLRVYLTLPPSGTPGTYHLKTDHPIQGSMLLKSCFQLIGPAISLAPVYVQRGTSQQLSIAGNMTHLSSATSISFLHNGVPSALIKVVQKSAPGTASMFADIVVQSNAPFTGTWRIRVSNPNDGDMYQTFYVLPPEMTISPATAKRGQSLSVMLAGKGTSFSQGPQSVLLTDGTKTYNLPGHSFVTWADTLTELRMTVPPLVPQGNYELEYSGMYDGKLKVPFMVTNPVASLTLEPTSAKKGDTITLLIRGTNTWFSLGATGRIFGFLKNGNPTGDLKFLSKAIMSDSLIEAKVRVESWALGPYGLRISDAYANASSVNTINIGTTGAEEPVNESILHIFPNPANGTVYANWPGSPDVVEVAVYNALGEKMISETCEPFTDADITRLTIPVNGLPPGLHLLNCRQAEAFFSAKLEIR